ncbi:hypothetical protein IKF57_02095 [Candidatus Saccharibacteria bacterium]|nr:hypothetical protein [Candidatus Saccharibacteria bacterium]
MNIYLDIDGVLVGTKSPREDVISFIRYILEHYPDSTYWLTTHCKGGVNRSAEWLRMNDFPTDLVDEMDRIIKPTDWGVMKTEAIDMDQDFIWFDDSLFETERRILEARYVLEDFYKMDPKDPEMAKKALEFLRSR